MFSITGAQMCAVVLIYMYTSKYIQEYAAHQISDLSRTCPSETIKRLMQLACFVQTILPQFRINIPRVGLIFTTPNARDQIQNNAGN